MTQIVGIDAETYYDTASKYGLRTMMMQEYIEDPRFQEIMWAACVVGKDKFAWQKGRADDMLNRIDWDETIMLAHNAQFDGAILDEHHGIRPRRIICSMAMARTLGIGKIAGGVSLHKLTTFLNCGVKGVEVGNMNGKRLEDLTREELLRYKKYNIQDVAIMNKAFEIMRPFISNEELLWNSCVNQMYCHPELSLNRDKLEAELVEIKDRRFNQQFELMCEFELNSIEEVQTKLGSNDQLAEILIKELNPESNEDFFRAREGIRSKSLTKKEINQEIIELCGTFGVPLKKSPTTGKPAFAFAKTDQGMKSLLEHDNPRIQVLAATRLGVKSNTEQTRIERLIALTKLPSDKFRIPHNISAAGTHRLGGTDGLNIQNFTSGRVPGQSKTARQSIVRKQIDGEIMTGTLAAPDSGQIEARVLAVICNDVEMMEVFKTGACPYSIMAEKVYRVHRDKIKKGDGLYKNKSAHLGVSAETIALYKQMYLYRQTGKAAVLQLGFGARYRGFHRSLRDMYGVTTVDEESAKMIVDVYDRERPAVLAMWEECKTALEVMAQGGDGYMGGADGKMFYYTSDHDIFGKKVPGIRLPNGTWLTYPMLHKRKSKDIDGTDNGFEEYAYYKDMKKYWRAIFAARKKLGDNPTQAQIYKSDTAVGYKQGSRLWHGTIIENLCQALAFAVLKWQGIRIAEKMPNCFNVHDEFIITGKNHAHTKQLAEQAKTIMETTPPWLPGAYFECEYGVADNYGDC